MQAANSAMESRMRDKSPEKRLNAEKQRPEGVEAEKASVWRETEIGLLPADWDVMPLGGVATFTRKPRSLDLSQFDEVPFVPMAQIPENGSSIEGYELRAGEDITSGTYCEKGNILLAKITPSFENGKQVVLNDIPLDFSYATTEVYAFDAKPNFADQMFLFYYFRLPSVRADLAGRMEGSTGRQRIRKNTIAGYPIIIPPLPEQRRIASALSTIQEAIAAQEGVIAAARELKHSLMERLFTYGPGPDLPMTKETEAGEIPEHWNVLPLKQIATFTRKPRSVDLSRFDQIPFVPMAMIPDDGSKIEGYELRASDELSSGTYCEKGDILLAKITPSFENGKQAILNDIPLEFSYATTEVYALDARPELIDSWFLFYYFRLPKVRSELASRMEGSTGRQRIRHSTLSEYPVVVPPLSEQRDIAHALRAVQEVISAAEQRNVALGELFGSALEQLMTGQIRLGSRQSRFLGKVTDV